MRIKAFKILAGAGMITAFCVFSLGACNDSDSKTSGETPKSPDSSAVSRTTASTMAATDSTVKDKTATSTAPVAKKKRKASVMMPQPGSEKMVKDKEGVYNYPEVMPEFPGGQDALSVYINDHLQYAQNAIDDDIAGKVKVSFVVDEKGKVIQARVIDGGKVGKGLDEEAVKVVSRMPSWKPGKVKGKNVKTRLELPISFQVEA